VAEVDYYELLGVRRDASVGEIKSAYRALAKVMHPDAGGTAGTFRLLKSAYETLVDSRKRAEYDLGEPAPTTPEVPRPRARRRMYRDEPVFTPLGCDLPPSSLSWWHLTKHQPRIGYVRTPGHAPAAAALVGSALLVIPLLLPSLPTPVLATWLALLVGALAAIVALVRSYVTAARGHKAALAEFGERTVFGEADDEPVGERLTAELLVNYLARLPGARVFHGLSRPGSVFADVDHAVLCGHRLVLVESKLWLPGHYEIDEDGSIWRNEHPFRGGGTNLFAAVAAFQDHLPDVDVRGVLLLYPNRRGPLTADDTPGLGVSAMVPDQFVRDIGDWLSVDCATVDQRVLRAVRARVVREPDAATA